MRTETLPENEIKRTFTAGQREPLAKTAGLLL
jgi:hypothetical protein